MRAKHQQEMLELKKQLRELKAADKANTKKLAADKSSAGSDIKAAEKALVDAQAQLKKEIEAHAALVVKHDAVKQQLEALTKEHKSTADKLKLATSGKQQAEAAMAATVSSLDQNLTAVTDELARVRQTLKQERAAKTAIEAKLAGGEAAVQKQKEEYQKVMTQRVAKLETANAELKAAKNSLAAELEQLQSELESKETMIMAMEAERDHMYVGCWMLVVGACVHVWVYVCTDPVGLGWECCGMNCPVKTKTRSSRRWRLDRCKNPTR